MLHIGLLIKEELRNQRRSAAWLADELSYERANVYRIFKKSSIDTHLLFRISLILQYNFFDVLAKDAQQPNIKGKE